MSVDGTFLATAPGNVRSINARAGLVEVVDFKQAKRLASYAGHRSLHRAMLSLFRGTLEDWDKADVAHLGRLVTLDDVVKLERAIAAGLPAGDRDSPFYASEQAVKADLETMAACRAALEKGLVVIFEGDL